MHGAIIGDIWGSIFESIPGVPPRLTMEPTDDSLLTCACLDFMQQLSDDELHAPALHEATIYPKAVNALKRTGRAFHSGGVFSPGFQAWAQQRGLVARTAKTNGCLMRHSPIALQGKELGLPLTACLELAKIFCHTTHDHPDAYAAVELHMRLLNQALRRTLTRADLAGTGLVQDLASWQALARSTKGRFIWDAQQSLGIALSGLVASDNWEEMMRFFIAVSGDVDTYAAIAGPIAQCVYPEPRSLSLLELHLTETGPVQQWVLGRYRVLKDMAIVKA